MAPPLIPRSAVLRVPPTYPPTSVGLTGRECRQLPASASQRPASSPCWLPSREASLQDRRRLRDTPLRQPDRSQPLLPMTPDRVGTMNHDHERHGTTPCSPRWTSPPARFSPTTSRDTATSSMTSRSISLPTTAPPTITTMSPDGSNTPHVVTAAHPLHTGIVIMAEPHRTLVHRTPRPAAQSRHLHQRSTAHRSHRAVDPALERRPETIHLAQDRRSDHRQSPTRKRCPQPDR